MHPARTRLPRATALRRSAAPYLSLAVAVCVCAIIAILASAPLWTAGGCR